MDARGDLNGWWWLGIVVLGSLARAMFRIKVAGVERIPASGPAVVAINHVSALDGIVLALVVGQRRRRMTRYLTAAEFFRKPAFGWALRLYRQIPLRRGQGDAGALDDAVQTVRSGALAGIFPEGLVNPAPENGIQRGRTGVARIALASGAVVVPVGIWGTQRRYPKAGFHVGPPWRPAVALAFGAPLEPEGDPASVPDTQRFTERVMEAIAQQTGEARRMAGA